MNHLKGTIIFYSVVFKKKTLLICFIDFFGLIFLMYKLHFFFWNKKKLNLILLLIWKQTWGCKDFFIHSIVIHCISLTLLVIDVSSRGSANSVTSVNWSINLKNWLYKKKLDQNRVYKCTPASFDTLDHFQFFSLFSPLVYFNN